MAKERKGSGNRLFVFEPNPDNNRLIPNEDLNILVELNTTKRGRSILTVDGNGTGSITPSSTTKARPIKFIAGSDYGTEKALTTNWSNASAKFRSDETNPDDLETLGIESIQIDFDTAYTPIIKIKFIDIRGTAIFSQGNGTTNTSKYNVFFELPYPLFELTVKGYFGKPVKYCLHLTKWNANFNSSTGNFEINADFIGYTYAALTDMLMGYLRAVVRTEEGEPIWNKAKAEYADAGIELKTIDEFIDDVQRVAEEFAKIKNDDTNVKQLEDNTKIREIIETINKRLVTVTNTIIPKNGEYFNNRGGILCCATLKAEEQIVKDTIKTQKDSIKIALDDPDTGLNNDITNRELKLASSKVTKFIQTDGLKGSDLKSEKSIAKALFDNGKGEYKSIEDDNTTDEDKKWVQDLAEIIKLNANGIKDEAELTIFDLRPAFNEIKRVEDLIDSKDKKLREEIGNELARKAATNLGFEPTIRNIFRIFTVHCEVLLDTIKAVSLEAEKKAERAKIMEEIIDEKTGNIKNGSDVHPWVEYREENTNQDEGGFVETWLGNNEIVKQNNNISSIPELVFVEHMIESLLELRKKDDELIKNDEENIGVRYYPVSPLDAPISSILISNNPYYEALAGEKCKTLAEEATRCLIMRGFLGMGLSNKPDKVIEKSMPETYGRFEADNLFQVMLSFDRLKAYDIVNQINEYAGNNPITGRQKLIGDWLKGYDNIENPTGDKKPMMEQSGDYYKYTYIGDGTKYYIPISGSFHGQDFYDDSTKTLKSNDDIRSNASFLHFTGNYTGDLKNREGSLLNGKWVNKYPEDGSVLFKIISRSTYEGSQNNPDYGLEQFEKYRATIPQGTVIRQNSVKGATYNDDKTLGSTAESNYFDYLGGTHGALEISDIQYDAGDTEDDESERFNYVGNGEIASVLCAYWNQPDNYWDEDYKGANYLCRGFNVDDYRSKGFSMYGTNGELKEFFTPLSDVTNENKEDVWDSLVDYGNQREIIGDLYGLTDKDPNKAFVPFIDFNITGEYEDYSYYSFSLFGSPWYYAQETNEARAFLFLHTFGWQGLIGDIRDVAGTKNDTKDVSLFDATQLDGESEGANGVDEPLKKTVEGTFDSEDDTYTIKSLYLNNGSFIKAPKLWIAFIGGILYRYDEYVKSGFKKDIIKFYLEDITLFGETVEKLFLLPWNHEDKINGVRNKAGSSYYPTPLQYLYDCRAQSNHGINLAFDSEDFEDKPQFVRYATIDNTIAGLPQQVREEFKKVFHEFVENEFADLQGELEIFDKIINDSGSAQAWGDKWQNINNNIKGTITTYVEKTHYAVDKFDKTYKYKEAIKTPGFKTDIIATSFSNTKAMANYMNISPTEDLSIWFKPDDEFGYKIYHYNLMLDPYGRGSKLIKNMITDYSYILNGSPRVFDAAYKHESTSNFTDIKMKKSNMEKYLDGFFTRWSELAKLFNEEKNTEEDELQQKVFNTIDDDIIKLSVYRTLGSIYNKWVAGVDKPFQQCGTCKKDERVAKGERGPSADIRLIDSFRFIDRAYLDIGDKFYLNPLAIEQLVLGNFNTSFFDIANKILIDNNFNFIPLPTYINYNKLEEVVEVFDTFTYADVVDARKKGSSLESGPAFVCCYVGQASTSLDLGESSQFPDDGIHVKLDSSGNIIPGSVPQDLLNSGSNTGDTINIPFFLVSYGRQNQSFFKNLKLDQTEFTETDESLQIIEDLSNSGDKRKPNYNGQNLWNVYQTRAYSAEIEMMGNAMVQPMMYFQLDDIPMFRGAYNIIKVTHNITPHNMTTKFKGTRVKRTKSPLIDAGTLFMSLLGSLDARGETRTIGAGSSLSAAQKERLDAARDTDPSIISDLNFQNPVNGGRISSEIGPRNVTSNKNASKFHKGIDIAVVSGSDLYAIGDGEVELIRLRPGFGLHMITSHTTKDGDTYRTMNAHLSAIATDILDIDSLTDAEKSKLVNTGIPILNKTIKKGQILGKTGGSNKETGEIKGVRYNGTSTGAHLHFEIHKNVSASNVTGNNSNNFKDPLQFIPLGYDDPKYAKTQNHQHIDDDADDDTA